MRNHLGLWLGLLVFVISCGKNPNTLSPTVQMQNELSYIMDETFRQAVVASSFATNKNLSQANAIAAATTLAAAVAPTCKTSFGVHLIGVDLNIQDTSSCLVAGTISVNFVPLSLSVNLDSTKLSFVNSFHAEASIGLGTGGSVSLKFLDGRISLRNLISLPWQDLVMNGRMSGKWAGALNWTMRANAFESASAMGVALLRKDLPDVPGWQSCFLTGGDPLNPDAGNLVACIGK